MKNVYDVDDLFIATIAPVIYKDDGHSIYTDLDSSFKSIVIKKAGKYFNLISRTYIMYFNNLSFHYLSKRMDKVFIESMTPMRQYLSNNKEQITIEEINSIYNKLNGIDNNKVDYKQTTTDINGLFLEIKKVGDKINENLSPELRELFSRRLISIAEYYTEKLIQNSKTKNNPDFEFNLLKECLDKLVAIEIEIDALNKDADYKESLRRNLNALKEEIRFKK